MGTEVSDVMLCGILRMPFDPGQDLHLIQLQQACREAASELERRADELSTQSTDIARLQEKLRQADVIASIALSERNFSVAKDAEIARLRAALEPFAAFATHCEAIWRGHADETYYAAGLRYGDLRRARAAAGAEGMNRIELIAKLQKATDPDAELNWEVHLACGLPDSLLTRAKPYTASIDAALSLVSRGYSAEIQTPAGDQDAIAELHVFESAEAPSVGGGKFFRWRHLGQVTHPTSAAIALCIAVLRARGDEP